MVHKTRRFCIVAADSAEELAHTLTERDWCRCCGFQLGDLLFLNDSFGGDSVAEYAVVRAGVQFESITFGWCSLAEAIANIRQCQATGPPDYPMEVPVDNRLEGIGSHGTCGHCA